MKSEHEKVRFLASAEIRTFGFRRSTVILLSSVVIEGVLEHNRVSKISGYKNRTQKELKTIF